MTSFRRTVLSIVAALTISSANAANRSCNSPTPVNSIQEMFDALFACWQPPAGTAGMSMTLRFSLRRDGTLISQPLITYKSNTNDVQQAEAFKNSILDAVNMALPVLFTDTMGGAVAGRPMSLRFISKGR